MTISCELERMFILQFINHVIKTYIPTEKNKFKKRLKARIIVNIKHPIIVLNTARHCKRSSGAGRRCSTAGLQPGNPWVGRWDSLGLHLRAYHQSWAKEVIKPDDVRCQPYPLLSSTLTSGGLDFPQRLGSRSHFCF